MFNLMHLGSAIKVDLIVRKDSEYRRVEFERRRSVECVALQHQNTFAVVDHCRCGSQATETRPNVLSSIFCANQMKLGCQASSEAINMKADTGTPIPYRVGEWLPSDQASLVKWLEAIIQKTLGEQKDLHPVIADFQALIESDPEIYMLFNQCLARRRCSHRQCLRIRPMPDCASRQTARSILDQVSAVLDHPHARERQPGAPLCRRNDLPGIPEPAQLSPLAQPCERHRPESLCERRDLLLRGPFGRLRPRRAE